MKIIEMMPPTLAQTSQIQKRIFTNIPLVLGCALVVSDVLAILSSCAISVPITAFLKAHVFEDDDFLMRLHDGDISHKLFYVLGAMTTFILWSKGLYTNRTPWWSQVRYIARITLFSFIIHGFIAFALKIYEPELMMFISWTLAFLLITALRAIVYKLSSFASFWKIPTVIISDNPTAEDLIYAFASDISTGYIVKRIFLRKPEDNIPFDTSILPLAQQNIRICYGQEDHETFIRENPEYFYIVSLDTFRDAPRESMIKTLNDNNIPYAIVPTLSRANLYQMEPKYFFGHDVVMLYVGNSAPQIFGMSVSRILKRLMDVGVSGLLLLMVSPIFLVIAIMLKIEGQGGSIFYGGKRIGKDGQLFNCWKFRSMEPDSNHLLESYLNSNPDAKSDWEKFRKLPNDPRVTTKTARIIRKTSLDEVPQLWNIFVGNMSLVGPRPILEDETHYFEEDALKEYLSVRPGLTGLWQVSGRNQTSFKRRVYWDSWYVRNWSLWGDIVILIKTPLVLLTRKGAS